MEDTAGVITNNKAFADAQIGTGNNEVATSVTDSTVSNQVGGFLNKEYLPLEKSNINIK